MQISMGPGLELETTRKLWQYGSRNTFSIEKRRRITPRTWILMAAWQFGFVAVLVLHVELTIAWNHVSGLQSFSSVGQLIPFILGVGGLGKVLWGKWRMVSDGVTEEELAKHNLMTEYEEAMAKYLESKKPGREKAIVRAMTA